MLERKEFIELFAHCYEYDLRTQNMEKAMGTIYVIKSWVSTN